MKYSQENICAECLLSCNLIKKEALAQGCFCEFCKIFRSRLFTEYIWMTASILQQLLALYFAVAYSWQLLSSEKALVGRKFIHISQHIYILIFFFFFVIFFDKCLFTLSVSDRLLYSEQTTVLLTWRHLNTMILTNFENLNSIWNIFQETHDFLFLIDPVIICIYLRITERHFQHQGNVHYSTKKLLGPNKYFLEPFFAEFYCQEGIFCLNFKNWSNKSVWVTHKIRKSRCTRRKNNMGLLTIYTVQKILVKRQFQKIFKNEFAL